MFHNPKQQKLFFEIAQACIDWYDDTGDCHFCCVIDKKHDDDCPVGEFLEVLNDK